MIYANNMYISTHKIYTLVSDAWTTCATKNTQNGTLVFPRSRIPDQSPEAFEDWPSLLEFGTIPSFSYLRIAGEGCTVDEYVYVTCIDICFHVYIYINTSTDVYNNICIIYVFIDKQIICTVYVLGTSKKLSRVNLWLNGTSLNFPSTAPPFVLPVSWNTKVVASSLEKPNINALPGHSGSSPPNIFLRAIEVMKASFNFPKRAPKKNANAWGVHHIRLRLVAHES